MAHDVFISYSSKDKTIADAVCAKLEEKNIRAWIAPRDVTAGSNFGQSIIRAINTCKVFVLIWSSNANTSEHILNEINQAFDRGITIIPFRIQDVQPTDEMRYYFGRTHWLDAIDPPLENHIAKLGDSILANLGREMQPGKAPTISDVMKEQAVEEVDEVKHAKGSPRQKKAGEVKEFQPSGASLTNLTKFIPIAAGGLVVVTLVVLYASGVFNGSSPTETNPSSAPLMVTPTPTRTVRPTATATAIPPWVEDVAEPILSAIKDEPPDFVEDFSDIDPNWNYVLYGVAHEDIRCSEIGGAGMSITDGSMKSSVDPNCPQIILENQNITLSANYVLQIDINLEQTTGEISLEVFYPSEETVGFTLSSYGAWFLGIFGPGGNFIEVTEGRTDFGSSIPTTVTIIYQSPYFLIYINSSLVLSKDDLEMLFPPVAMDFNMWNNSSQFSEIETFELDNIKVWDLDKLDY